MNRECDIFNVGNWEKYATTKQKLIFIFLSLEICNSQNKDNFVYLNDSFNPILIAIKLKIYALTCSVRPFLFRNVF